MKLPDLTKNISNMSTEDLLAHVRTIRHTKYVAKPAVKHRADEAEKKEKNTKIRSVNKMLDGMSADEKRQLLLELGVDMTGDTNG